MPAVFSRKAYSNAVSHSLANLHSIAANTTAVVHVRVYRTCKKETALTCIAPTYEVGNIWCGDPCTKVII
jgi:hypothetical protein